MNPESFGLKATLVLLLWTQELQNTLLEIRASRTIHLPVALML